jgi:hypothetical protein
MLNLVANGSSGYNLTNSLRFRSSASAYLSRTPASAGNRQKFTWSGWVKRGGIDSATNYTLFSSGTTATDYDTFRFLANSINLELKVASSFVCSLTTTAVYRDPSSWYHIVLSVDTTQATASNRVIMYVNGSQITSFSSTTYPSLNQNFYIDSTSTNYTGVLNFSGFTQYLDGYLAEVNFIDGQQLTPSSFGSTNATTGVWQPAKYTGTYGTNGFYLNFNSIALTSGSNTGLGKDNSGNGNYWNTNNISVTAGTTYDAMTDVPTNTSATVGNYAVLNPLSKGTNASITNANLSVSYGAVAWTSAFGTMGVSTGKWYWEITLTSAGTDVGVGISTNPAGSANSYIGSDANSWGYYGSNGNKWNNNSQTAYGATYANGDVIGVALDLDAGTLVFYKNNTSQGTAFSSLASSTYFPALSVNNSSFAANFGQRPFTYTAPTGYVALNTYNLPDSTIVKGNKYMDATLYTGNLTGQSITNAAAFKPDLVWIKSRSAATDNKLTDSVRGATIALISNSTAAETTDTTGMTAFNTNGFTIGASTVYNNTSATYVGWQWQAGQGSSSSNTNGSITSTVSVNATAGFSIVTYTGNGGTNVSVGHGLGVAPVLVLTKDRTSTGVWDFTYTFAGGYNFLELDSTAAAVSITGRSSPTSSVYYVNGTNSNVNARNYVTYCWTPIAGFSKFGSYTGNGSTDGPFVFTNFQPKFILLKRTDSTSNWYLFDTARDTYNVMKDELLPNSTNAEADNTRWIDILSNGFKIRNDNVSQINASGATMIYMAFASNPFKNSLAH